MPRKNRIKKRISHWLCGEMVKKLVSSIDDEIYFGLTFEFRSASLFVQIRYSQKLSNKIAYRRFALRKLPQNVNVCRWEFFFSNVCFKSNTRKYLNRRIGALYSLLAMSYHRECLILPVSTTIIRLELCIFVQVFSKRTDDRLAGRHAISNSKAVIVVNKEDFIRPVTPPHILDQFVVFTTSKHGTYTLSF